MIRLCEDLQCAKARASPKLAKDPQRKNGGLDGDEAGPRQAAFPGLELG